MSSAGLPANASHLRTLANEQEQQPSEKKGKGFDLFMRRSMLLDGNAGSLGNAESSGQSEAGKAAPPRRQSSSGSELFARRASELDGTLSDDVRRMLGLTDDDKSSEGSTGVERSLSREETRRLTGAQLFLKRSQLLDGDGNLTRELNPEEWEAMMAQAMGPP